MRIDRGCINTGQVTGVTVVKDRGHVPEDSGHDPVEQGFGGCNLIRYNGFGE